MLHNRKGDEKKNLDEKSVQYFYFIVNYFCFDQMKISIINLPS